MITSVLVRCGDGGLDVVNDGGDVGDPGEEGMETLRLFFMTGSA